MVPSSPEEQRFDFGSPSAEAEERDASESEAVRAADELLARVEAVRAVAARGARRVTRAQPATEVVLRALPGSIFDEPPSAEVPAMSAEPTVDFDVDDFDIDKVLEEEPEPEGDSLSIAEFYERVRRALQAEFTDEVWVTGEIRGLRVSRGHRYLELADEGAEPGRAPAQQLEVVCWARDWPTVAAALDEAGADLEVGRVVRVRGKVSVWEGGSRLRFTLTALDVEALLGGIAAARRRLLAVLGREGLLDANRRHLLPLVPLRIGVVTSPGSEGHRDFVGQLRRSGFAFLVHLEPSLVQGMDAPAQLARALQRLEEFGPDLAVIVRGGGGRGDLAAFDTEEVARAIALAPFPVWSGVGHTGDRSVADEVVHSAWITPTACGEAVVARVASYWDDVARRLGVLAGLARARLDATANVLRGRERAIATATRHQLDRHGAQLASRRVAVVRGTRGRLEREQAQGTERARALRAAAWRSITGLAGEVTHQGQMLRAYDPRRQFERGWSLTRDESGHLVRSVEDLAEGTRIVTRLADGEASSTVDAVRPDLGGHPRVASTGEAGDGP